MDEQTHTIEIELPNGTVIPIRGDKGASAERPLPGLAEQINNMDPDERRKLVQGTGSILTRIQDELGAPGIPRLFEEIQSWDWLGYYREYKDRLDNSYQALLDAGYSERDLALMQVGLMLDMEWVAQRLQDKAGYCPVGEDLVNQLRDGAPKGRRVRGQSARVTASLSGFTERQVNTRLSGDQPITVNEAARLAIAYNVTTAELLGFMDADEVRLLSLWRETDAKKREAVITLLS